MLKITPYLGVLVLMVCIGGIWYPLLGYMVPLVFALVLLTAPFRAGAFLLRPLHSREVKIPKWILSLRKLMGLGGTP